MDYNPNEVIISIKKQEFKFLLVPLILIILNFILVYKYHLIQLKYISLILLIIYFFIKVLFRIDKIDVEPVKNAVKSPITGKVIKVDKDKIVIKKNLFDKSDFRATNVPIQITKGKVYKFYDSEEQSVLIGVAPGIGICIVNLPENFVPVVKFGNKVIAGVTDLGKADEKH